MPLPTTKQFHHKRRGLFFASETTAGTYLTDASVFLASAGVVPTESIVFSPEVTWAERNTDSLSLSPTASVPGQSHAKISFTSRWIAGAKGVAGPLSPLLLAAGMKEVLVASTSATYYLDPSSTTRLSMGVGIASEDGAADLQYAISGAVCTKLTIKADGPGKPIMADWEFTGKIASVTGAFRTTTDGTFPAITYIDDVAKGFRFISLTATTGKFSRAISKLELDMGLSGELGVDIADVSGHDFGHFSAQKPVLSIDPLKVAGSVSQDINLLLAGGTTSAGFTVSNGTDTFTVAIPRLQDQSAGDAARGPMSTWDIKALCVRSQTAATPDAASPVSLAFA